jgi:signal transduction histidine kinase/DNA-binding NarL/FixJ family response regulator
MISASERTRPVRVVIIDDTYDLRELLRLALTRGGLEVVGEAGDGLSGIECVRLEKPDVVLLDLSMPVMDGLEALPTIRRIVPEARIIVLSGFGATQMSEKAMLIGADGYLQKGMALKRIIEYVQNVIDAPRPVRSASGARTERVAQPSTPSPAPEAREVESLDATAEAARALSLVRPEDADADDSEAAAIVARATQSFAAAAATKVPADPATRSDNVYPEVAAWDALTMSPYAVIEVADEPLFRVVFANPVAQRHLDHRARFGIPLGSIAPELASHVAFHRLDGESTFEVSVNGTSMQASLRRTDGSLLVYLDSSSEDVGVLRRAIASTAQEIRGPVAVLCGVAESISQAGEEMSDSQRRRLMSSVTRQARMLDSITADLLTAAEIQRGELHLDPQSVDPLAAIDAVIADRYLVAVSAQIDDDRRVMADPMRLEQMLSNLIGNALKYGRAPYVVRVEAAPDRDDALRILVIDSGEGVPEDFADELFGEFTRGTGAVANGTGLGLYVVKCLAEAQDGQVEYFPGQTGGAVFAITLPVAGVKIAT